MKMILKKNVKDLGRTGDIVSVSSGYARNFLLPRRLAVSATEKRIKEFEHWKRVAQSRKKKEREEMKTLMGQLANISIVFKLKAGEKDKLFGSVTNRNISDELEKQGYNIDKRHIIIPSPIKVLGQHKALVKLDEEIQQEIVITVERLNGSSS